MNIKNMSEVEKIGAGLEYDLQDEEVNARRLGAEKGCQKLNTIPSTECEARVKAIKELFGSVGNDPSVAPGFNCDNGKNIYVGNDLISE